MRRLMTQVLLAVSTVGPIHAQLLDSARTAASAASVAPTASAELPPLIVPKREPRTTASTRSMVLGGFIGGAIGAFGGAMVGKAVENCEARPHEHCGETGTVIGAILGEAIGVPVGVNWVGNGGGTLQRSIPASIAITVGGLLVAPFAPQMVVGIPIMQFYSAIHTERYGTVGLFGR